MFKKRKVIKEMTREQKYDLVNKTTNSTDLINVINKIADKEGLIQGETHVYDAFEMSTRIKDIIEGEAPIKLLPTDYNLRQQALYLRSIKHPLW